jgi:hypothetical protein
MSEEESDFARQIREEAETLEAQGTQYVHRPDELDLRAGMVCWLESTRVCGPDCVAFNPEELDEHGAPNNVPTQCLVLTYMGQSGAAALVTVSKNRRELKHLQDQQRQSMQGPPPPKVGA